jgi:hypothetical protein
MSLGQSCGRRLLPKDVSELIALVAQAALFIGNIRGRILRPLVGSTYHLPQLPALFRRSIPQQNGLRVDQLHKPALMIADLQSPLFVASGEEEVSQVEAFIKRHL